LFSPSSSRLLAQSILPGQRKALSEFLAKQTLFEGAINCGVLIPTNFINSAMDLRNLNTDYLEFYKGRDLL
jgi:hypothetical protein